MTTSASSRSIRQRGAIEWVVAGCGLTFATCLMTAGRIGDLIDRRRAFSIGLGLFSVTARLRRRPF
jgi:MFS family permease